MAKEDIRSYAVKWCALWRARFSIFTDLRPTNVIFHTRFQTWPLKSIPVFRPGLQAKIMLSLLSLQRKQKNSSNPFQILIFFFLSYSFGIETIKTFIQSRIRSSLKNHTRFQPKLGKVYTHFQTATAQNPTRWGGICLYSSYKGSTPPPRVPTSPTQALVM